MPFDDGPRPEMTAEEFRLLAELIYEHCGILFRADMRYLLERRLASRLKANGLADFSAYYRLLRFDPRRKPELEAAVEALTTNETYFFREPQQLRAFSEELLPRLARERARSGRLRIWSAGCSTGEEAYTIAMLVQHSRLFVGWDVEILGSDISRRVLAVARRGIYQKSSLREPMPEHLARCFRVEGSSYVVADEIRQMVTFGHMNLLDENTLLLIGHMDVIFCRNVMIYFDLAARRRVLKSFHSKLVDGGYLLLGHSESLINVTADFELVHLKHDLVYRKPIPGG
ncbi:MAG: CheR family methyltransferase [Myxococcales bacterium]|jgi:chemotaxis protein methyltransferase CheR